MQGRIPKVRQRCKLKVILVMSKRIEHASILVDSTENDSQNLSR